MVLHTFIDSCLLNLCNVFFLFLGGLDSRIIITQNIESKSDMVLLFIEKRAACRC